MGSRLIYEGSLAVDGAEYTHTVEKDDDYVEVEVEGLDERVTPLTTLRFTLDYPFDKPYQGTIITDAGASLRHIFDGIRHGFRVMYRGASHEKIPNLLNQRVEGDYGRAVHSIDDLVIESIELDDDTGVLEIGIGS